MLLLISQHRVSLFPRREVRFLDQRPHLLHLIYNPMSRDVRDGVQVLRNLPRVPGHQRRRKRRLQRQVVEGRRRGAPPTPRASQVLRVRKFPPQWSSKQKKLLTKSWKKGNRFSTLSKLEYSPCLVDIC